METFSPLATRKTVDLSVGELGYREAGCGMPVVFVHGIVANGLAWRNVAREVSRYARCVAPDWPLGSHVTALPGADLSLTGVARLVVETMDALEIDEAVVVGNGYGGDVAQVLAARYPDRCAGLVLVATNSFDSDPAPTKILRNLTALPAAFRLQSLLMRTRFAQRLPITYGGVTKRPIPDEVMQSYLRPLLTDRGVFDDFARFLRELSPSFLADASPRLAGFNRPALLVWPAEERFFPAAGTRRLAETLPNARLVTVDDAYSWIPEDQPDVLSEFLLDFLREHRFVGADGPVTSASPESTP